MLYIFQVNSSVKLILHLNYTYMLSGLFLWDLVGFIFCQEIGMAVNRRCKLGTEYYMIEKTLCSLYQVTAKSHNDL